MIQVQRADDLERQALRLELEAEELGADEAARKRGEARQLRALAARMRRGRAEGVRFG